MIKLENTEVLGWEAAIRGMRNPLNSWSKSDSWFETGFNTQNGNFTVHSIREGETASVIEDDESYMNLYYDHIQIGPNDHDLMMRLAKAGSVDAKYRRMIVVTVDITAPLYWWKEFDTYKVGTVANSCSTMHKIHAKEFTRQDFSDEHLLPDGSPNEIPTIAVGFGGNDLKLEEELIRFSPSNLLDLTISMLNRAREMFLETKDKKYWWQMIQLLPSSYNQRRTVMLNYEVLAGIYPKRKDHKLDCWHDFCDWIKSLPYSEIITLEE